MMCFQNCLIDLAGTAARQFSPTEKVAFIVDERAKVKHHVETARVMLRTTAPRAIRERIGPLSFDNSVAMVPLQAADLLAYETHRVVRGSLFGQQIRPEAQALRHRIQATTTFRWVGTTRRLYLWRKGNRWRWLPRPSEVRKPRPRQERLWPE
jgi:hypothetical protein